MRHDPPAPMLTLSVRTDGGGAATRVEFFVDTGADFTCLPRAAVAALGRLPRGPEKRFRAGDGSRGSLPTVRAEVGVLGAWYGGFYAVTDGPVGLLGRNILRHVKLTIDGPAGTLTVED